MLPGGRSIVVEPQLRVLPLRMVRARATTQSLAAAVAALAAAAAAATSAEAGSLPGGWGVGKPMGGGSRGWLRGGRCVLLVLLPTSLAACRRCLRTLEFQ